MKRKHHIVFVLLLCLCMSGCVKKVTKAVFKGIAGKNGLIHTTGKLTIGKKGIVTFVAKQAVGKNGVGRKVVKKSYQTAKVVVKTTCQLIKDLTCSNWKVRKNAIKQLVVKKDPAALIPLITTLRDLKSDVRCAGAEALGIIIDNRSVSFLIDALTDKDKAVRKASSKALEKITGKLFGMCVNKWKEWYAKRKIKREEEKRFREEVDRRQKLVNLSCTREHK